MTHGESTGLYAQRTTIKYLGFDYELSSGIKPTKMDYMYLFYTGEKYDGKKIFVHPGSLKLFVSASNFQLDPGAGPAGISRHKSAAPYQIPNGKYVGVPQCIFMRGQEGFTPYTLVGIPPVYAYTIYGAYNTSEKVVIGIERTGGEPINPRVISPWKAELEKNGGWEEVYVPQYVYIPEDWLYNKNSVQWDWDQKRDNGELVPPGNYRVTVLGKYTTYFRIDGSTPSVDASPADFTDKNGANDICKLLKLPQLRAYDSAYEQAALTSDLGHDMKSLMLYKAAAKGLDYTKLKLALGAANVPRDASLPCTALHSNFKGKPAWVTIFSILDGDRFSKAHISVVDDDTSKVVYESTGDILALSEA